MKVIDSGPTFCASGAVVFEKRELRAIIRALSRERKRTVERRRGVKYSSMSIRELDEFISGLKDFKDKKGK
ncbi:MAG: hypothetical protein Q7R84_02000 [bacterium]|nr:hypothetical protein [bacterium]